MPVKQPNRWKSHCERNTHMYFWSHRIEKQHTFVFLFSRLFNITKLCNCINRAHSAYSEAFESLILCTPRSQVILRILSLSFFLAQTFSFSFSSYSFIVSILGQQSFRLQFDEYIRTRLSVGADAAARKLHR